MSVAGVTATIQSNYRCAGIGPGQILFDYFVGNRQ
jgi:hypothetical protein